MEMTTQFFLNFGPAPEIIPDGVRRVRELVAVLSNGDRHPIRAVSEYAAYQRAFYAGRYTDASRHLESAEAALSGTPLGQAGT